MFCSANGRKHIIHTIENHSGVQEQQLNKKCHFKQDPTQHEKNSDHGPFSAQNKGMFLRVFGVLQLRDIDTNLQTFWTSSIGLDLLGMFITDSSCDPMLHCHCKLHQLWFHLPSSKFHLILPLCFCCSISCHEKNILETRYATIISPFLCSACPNQKPHIGISLLGFWDKIACNGFLTCRRSISSSTSSVSPCKGCNTTYFFILEV